MLQPVQNNSRPAIGRTYSEDESAAMLRAVIKLFDKWGLTDAEAAILLGGVSAKSFQRWRNGQSGRINIDQADRMSNLLGIHKALRILFPDRDRFYAWVNKPNVAFGGQSARDIMLGGHLSDIQRVRNYLDSVRGGW